MKPMHPRKNKIIFIVSNTLLAISVFLIIVNIIGFFKYTTIDENNIYLLTDHPRKVSEEEFWNNAFKKDNETPEQYLKHFTELVSDRMLLIDSKYTKPTIFENWILWIPSQYLGYYEWIDTKKAVRLGGGFCSQHAIVFNKILRMQGIESRILGLGGHVVNEVLIGNRWRVYDSTYNVIFDASLKELESNPELVYRTYKSAGLSEDEAKYYQDTFVSEADNRYFKSFQHYGLRHSLIEKASFFLIWFIPIVLLLSGLFIKKWIIKPRRCI